MSKNYKTSEIASIIGIHPNTVRLYEELKLIPKPLRLSNGYRVFSDIHVSQFRLARRVLKVEILQNGLRKIAIDIIKTSARGDYDRAISMTNRYIELIRKEISNADEALCIVNDLLLGKVQSVNEIFLTRKEVGSGLLTKQLNHFRKRIILRIRKPIELMLTFALPKVLIATIFNELPENLSKRRIENFDNEYHI